MGVQGLGHGLKEIGMKGHTSDEKKESTSPTAAGESVGWESKKSEVGKNRQTEWQGQKKRFPIFGVL